MYNYHVGQSLIVRAKSSRNPDPNLSFPMLSLLKLCCRGKHKNEISLYLVSTKQSGVYVFFYGQDDAPGTLPVSGAQTDRWYRNHRPCLQKEAFPFRRKLEKMSKKNKIKQFLSISWRPLAWSQKAAANAPQKRANVEVKQLCHGFS